MTGPGGVVAKPITDFPYFMAQHLKRLHEESNPFAEINDSSPLIAAFATERAVLTTDASSLAGAAAQVAVFLALCQDSRPNEDYQHGLVSALAVLLVETGIDLASIMRAHDMKAIGNEVVKLADKLRRQRAIA